MGMDARIKTLYNGGDAGEEGYAVRWGNLIASAARAIGKGPEDGCVALNEDDVRAIVGLMWVDIYTGKAVQKAGWSSESSMHKISVQHLMHMQGDLETLRILVEWLNDPIESEEREIFFA